MDDNSESDERDSAAVRKRSPKAPKSPWWLLFWLAVLAVLLCYLHGDQLANQLGVPIWIAFAIITLANVLLLPLVVILAVVIFALIQRFLFQSEQYDFSRARKSAGEEGTVVRLGQVVIWFSGVGKGMQMLEDELERTRQRFADLVGEPVEIRRPLRLMSFARQHELALYLRHYGYQFGMMDGFYLLSNPRRIVLCAERPMHRLIQPDRLLRVLCGYYFVEQHLGFFPPPWLYMGVGNLLADNPTQEASARLRRKMLAAIATRIVLEPVQFFDVKIRALARRFKRSNDLKSIQFISQFTAQAYSVVQFLCEKNRRATFLAFLKDLKKKEPLGPVFTNHFGYDLGQLLVDWQKWVMSQGPGRHFPPPADLKDALLNRIIPFINDPEAPSKERIQAIRDMGNLGYALGSDSLIELLNDPDPTIRAISLWSLQSISGMAYGEDGGPWTSWWDNLPADAEPTLPLPGFRSTQDRLS